MDVSVSFSNNQIHEARTQEDREKLNAQMEKDSPWIVCLQIPKSHTHHSWKLGRRQVRFKQRDEFEAQIQWLVSSVRQRLAKGCLVLVPGGGTPSPRKCEAKFAASWVAWAGWPVCVTCHRGVQNRGVFAQVLSAHGVHLRTAGVEAAEQIGRCERHGCIFKHNLSLVVTACGIQGKAAMKMAAATCVSVKNELVRQGGIAPSQWSSWQVSERCWSHARGGSAWPVGRS